MKIHERNVYLSNLEVDKALELFMDRAAPDIKDLKKEVINTVNSLGRITSEPVFAKYSSPNYNASAMDGIAVRAKDTFGASEGNPIQLKLNENFVFLDTGDPICEPFNAVIMIEDLVEIDENTFEIIKGAAPWQHIRPIGEDIVARELIITANHEIRPVDLGALLSGGITEINVYQQPRIGLIPTGSEIIEPGAPMKVDSIIESNSWVFAGMTRQLGGIPCRYQPVADDYQLLKEKISLAVQENDILIVNAGSSAGSEDYTVNLIRELGEVLVHGIAAKPGKPTILGIIEGKPIIGIPGYPVSAFFAFETFASPLIKAFQGQRPKERPLVEAVVSKRIVSSLQNREYVRMKLGKVDHKLIATPLNRGAGMTMSLVRADGILVIPQESEGVEGGEQVQIELLKSMDEIDHTIVSIGSHDLLLDIIVNLMQEVNSPYFLASAHVGSLGGIMALKRGEAHLAPIHLLDERDGSYNVSYIKRYLGDMDMSLIKGVKRIQGFMVKQGNPKGIRGFNDIKEKDLQFVNRQKGAGTRLLVDYQLKGLGINPGEISGYDREMTTHMAVAAAISSNSADLGMGVLSAARAMGLDFIPLAEESYDFAIPTRYLRLDMIKEFIRTLQSPEFKAALHQLGGYKLDEIGEVNSFS
ncbi:molybdopterin biosynthesis protein [Dehalobacterium formicoaceticum]|uniref:Molybdopterin molybdenumtransferase n=1 Tax=Dehalobacterium formicoaceticum TaxID=51515 RepID=A0ABT1Y0Y3_9FIRM|nr:molybdopterin biosynthesis protein [Dehalobacterium formicoaceticum]MCR6544186.1 molybdopterin biosynthesis protein [Dehalobacterium formicoaceticum]